MCVMHVSVGSVELVLILVVLGAAMFDEALPSFLLVTLEGGVVAATKTCGTKGLLYY